jgi:hypothetical protein
LQPLNEPIPKILAAAAHIFVFVFVHELPERPRSHDWVAMLEFRNVDR